MAIQCRRCGHIQDEGSALAPNYMCEACGAAIYGPKTYNPKVMTVLAIVTCLGAAVLGMPKNAVLSIGVMAVFLIATVILQQRR